MKNAILSMLFILLFIKLDAQSYSPKGFWIGKDQVYFEIKDSIIHSRQFDFLSQYNLKNDTLYITHNYTGMSSYSIDSTSQKIETKGWKLPDSQFQILKLTKDELILYPLNPSAMKIAGEIRQSNVNYSMESYKKLYEERKKSGANASKKNLIDNKSYSIFGPASIDTIKLKSISSIRTEMIYDSISISSYSQGYFGDTFYYDLKLYNNGQFLVRSNSKTFKGSISEVKVKELNNLLSESGISNKESKEYFGYTSHGNNINFKVYYNSIYKQYKGVQSFFDILIQPIIRELLSIDNYDLYQKVENIDIFETTYLK